MLFQVASDAQAVRAVIKLQALFRGHKARKRVKNMRAKRMQDKFGQTSTGIEGNYKNSIVDQVLNKIGSFNFHQ